jgi:hypothetical protein
VVLCFVCCVLCAVCCGVVVLCVVEWDQTLLPHHN